MNAIRLNRHRRVALFLAAGLLTLLSIHVPQASAQIINAQVVIKGMACPFCAYGVEKKLGQVKGVTEVTVDMKTGAANLTFAKGFSLDLAALQKAIRKAGFTMGTVTIGAVGSLMEQDGHLALAVRDTKQKFLLFESAGNEGERGGGRKPALLTSATEKALRKMREAKAAVKVTGPVHTQQQGLNRLQVKSYEAVK